MPKTLDDAAIVNLPFGSIHVDNDKFHVWDDDVGQDKWSSAKDIVKSVIKKYASTGASISANSAHNFAHGFGAEPDFVTVILQCTTADLNWSVGNRVPVHGLYEGDLTGTDSGILLELNSTNVVVHVGDNISLYDKSSYEIGAITPASWDLYVKALYYPFS